MITLETLPVLVSSLGLGIGLAYALVGKHKHAAIDAMQHKIDTLKKLLDEADKDAEVDRLRRKELEVDNARLAARLASLENNRGHH